MWAPLLAVADVIGIDLTGVCQAHGEVLEKRTSLQVRDALEAVLSTLSPGRYRLCDLRQILGSRYGQRLSLVREEHIGWAFRSLSWPVKRDARGRFVEIPEPGIRGVVQRLVRKVGVPV